MRIEVVRSQNIWIDIFLLFVFLSVGSCCQSTGSALERDIYYVAESGDDGGSGSVNDPFGTIQYAIDRCRAGDTVIVRGGTYFLPASIWIDATGTPFAWITIRSYSGERPIIDGSTYSDDASCVIMAGDYILFSGFEVRNSPRGGITVWGGSHIAIRNNFVHDCQRAGIYVGYSEMSKMRDVVIDDNTVYRTCLSNDPPPVGEGSGWPSGIGVFFVDGAVVSNNRVYENYGEGIIMGLMNGGETYSNIVYDNYSVALYIDNATDVSYHGNHIYDTGKTEFYRYGAPANGIQIANETYEFANRSNHIRVFNNVIIGARKGISYGGYQEGGGLHSVSIVNNTVYDSVEALISIDEDDGHTDTEIVNNVFYRAAKDGPGEAVVYDGDPGITFHHNAWYGVDPESASGTGDIYVDPLLADVADRSNASGFRPRPDSPLIDAGYAINFVDHDFAGNRRPSGHASDIGALEYTAAAR